MKRVIALIGSFFISCSAFATPAFYITTQNGMVCDGVTDDTAAFNALLTGLQSASGGSIAVDGTCLISGQVLFPNDNGTIPTQKPIRITGYGSSANGQWHNPPDGPSALDLRYNASVAKFDTRGLGMLEIDHVTLKDGGTDCATFIQTTNTTLHIHDVLFKGTAAQGSACNNVLVLGGSPHTFHVGGDSTDGFQGYGTVIRDSFCDKCQTFVTFNDGANNVVVSNNTISLSSGASSAGVGAIVFNDAMGNIVTQNLIEVGSYYYGFVFNSGANTNFVVGNGTWDAGFGAAQNVSDYYCPNGGGNIIIPAIAANATVAKVFGTGGNCNAPSGFNWTVSTQNGGQGAHYPYLRSQNYIFDGTAGLASLGLGGNGDKSCLEMQNSDGTHVTNYLSFLNGVMQVSTTKPAWCK